MNAGESQAAPKASGWSTGVWFGLYCALVGIIIALRATDTIAAPAGLILFGGAMALLIPLVRSIERRRAASGCMNPVILRYNRRILAASMGYVAGLGIAIALWNAYDLSGPVVFAIALLPTLPTFAMIWAMARYVVEEQDEYLRHRAIQAAMMGLGLVLIVGIFWGFLEMFELVPHIWAWWVLPAWSVGMGFAQVWMKVRGE